MWLSDFEEAIVTMREVLKECCGLMKIEWTWDGERAIFSGEAGEKSYLVYFRKSHRIEKHYEDTWRNPEHKEVIYEGDK